MKSSSANTIQESLSTILFFESTEVLLYENRGVVNNIAESRILPDVECRLLRFFHEHPNTFYSADDLVKIFKEDVSSRETIRQQITRLRKAIPPLKKYLKTERVGHSSKYIYYPPKSLNGDFLSIIKTHEFRQFVTAVLGKYYGDDFTFSFENADRRSLSYIIESTPLTVPEGKAATITSLDSLICPLDKLERNLRNFSFYKDDHQEYKSFPLYEEYYNASGKYRIHYPDRPGYMLKSIDSGVDGAISISAKFGTYAENCYSCHVLEYELYKAYVALGCPSITEITDSKMWEECYTLLPLRNSIHNNVDRSTPSAFFDTMRESLHRGDNRYAEIGTQMLVLVKSAQTHKYEALFAQRSDSVALGFNSFQFIPSGGFEVLSDARDGEYSSVRLEGCYSPGLSVFREYLEELFDIKKLEGSEEVGSPRAAIQGTDQIKAIEKMLQDGDATLQFLGCTIELLYLRANLGFILAVHNEDYSNVTNVLTANNEIKNHEIFAKDINSINQYSGLLSELDGASAGLWRMFMNSDLCKTLLEMERSF